MKNLIKKLFYAKIGAGVVSGILAYRKKKQAVDRIEQSGFFSLMQRIKYHPRTHRSDGFYKVVYRFEADFGRGNHAEARVISYRPIDKLMVKDGLEINIKLGDRSIDVAQEIEKKPLFEQGLIPLPILARMPGYIYLKQKGSEAELAEAYEILEQVLSE